MRRSPSFDCEDARNSYRWKRKHPMTSLGLKALAVLGAVCLPLAGHAQDRSVFLEQIGSGNVLAVRQAGSATATITQAGSDNRASVDQGTIAGATLSLRQEGVANDAAIDQRGSGRSDLRLVQLGTGNAATLRQAGSAGINVAAVHQTGTDNRATLAQGGQGNEASLTQTGSDNIMSAVQNGRGNTLVWNQVGQGLSDLAIVQSGGQAIQITQTR